MVYTKIIQRFDPLTTRLFKWNLFDKMDEDYFQILLIIVTFNMFER